MKLAPNADDARVGPDCDVGTAAINCLISSSTRARSTLSSVKATCVPCYLPMRFITTKRVRFGSIATDAFRVGVEQCPLYAESDQNVASPRMTRSARSRLESFVKLDRQAPL